MKLYCPHCEDETEMLLSLDNGKEVTCNDCTHTHDIADMGQALKERAEVMMRRASDWARVVKWVATMPK